MPALQSAQLMPPESGFEDGGFAHPILPPHAEDDVRARKEDAAHDLGKAAHRLHGQRRGRRAGAGGRRGGAAREGDLLDRRLVGQRVLAGRKLPRLQDVGDERDGLLARQLPRRVLRHGVLNLDGELVK